MLVNVRPAKRRADTVQDQPRLHAEPGLSGHASIAMAPGQAHYLGHVLRRQPGDRVRLFNAADGEWLVRIDALRKDRGSFVVEQQMRAPAPEPGPTLLFAPIKRDGTDLVVRMATELGVSSLQPVMTERTNTARVNTERWMAIATEAAEQCERLSVPAIAEPVRLMDLLGTWNPGQPMLAAIERAEQRGAGTDTVAAWRARTDPGVQPGLLIGPEGGFSAAELELLRTRPFVVTVSLGRLILRAETACLAGLAGLVF